MFCFSGPSDTWKSWDLWLCECLHFKESLGFFSTEWAILPSTSKKVATQFEMGALDVWPEFSFFLSIRMHTHARILRIINGKRTLKILAFAALWIENDEYNSSCLRRMKRLIWLQKDENEIWGHAGFNMVLLIKWWRMLYEFLHIQFLLNNK